MKKLSILTSLLVGLLLFAACDADRDDNPVLDLSKTQDPIHLNTPTFAGGFYDLQNTDTIFFACTAPNYGFPATVTYALEVSIDEDMSNPTRLTTTYSKNGMDVASREVAIGVTKQMMDKQNLKQENFPVEAPVYIRIHAFIDGVEGSEAFSNIVKLNKVKTKFALPDVKVPEQFYVDDDKLERWRYLKGSKSEERVKRAADGTEFTYHYSEGSMAFPDLLENPSRTILTGEGGAGASRFKHIVEIDGRYRRLVPDELDQLQCFPKGWTATGMSDGHRAFCMGNALVVGIPHLIGKEMSSRI
jgi:hypothetical protein